MLHAIFSEKKSYQKLFTQKRGEIIGGYVGKVVTVTLLQLLMIF